MGSSHNAEFYDTFASSDVTESNYSQLCYL